MNEEIEISGRTAQTWRREEEIWTNLGIGLGLGSLELLYVPYGYTLEKEKSIEEKEEIGPGHGLNWPKIRLKKKRENYAKNHYTVIKMIQFKIELDIWRWGKILTTDNLKD